MKPDSVEHVKQPVFLQSFELLREMFIPKSWLKARWRIRSWGIIADSMEIRENEIFVKIFVFRLDNFLIFSRKIKNNYF